jgi:hypothetical protein
VPVVHGLSADSMSMQFRMRFMLLTNSWTTGKLLKFLTSLGNVFRMEKNCSFSGLYLSTRMLFHRVCAPALVGVQDAADRVPHDLQPLQVQGTLVQQFVLGLFQLEQVLQAR